MIRDFINAYREAFRQWVRRRTRPKTIFEAEEKKLFWSKCYLFSITCAIGIYLLQSYKENINFGYEKNLPRALQIAKGINQNEPIRIVKFSGFRQVSDKTFDVKELEKDVTLMGQAPSEPKVS